MCKKKYFLIAFLLCVTIENALSAMTVKQLQAGAKVLRNLCQPKTKATSEDIDKMHRGDWDIDHTAMCYMYCCMSTYHLMDKDNRFDHDSALAQLKQIPDVYREVTEKCMNECKDAAVTLDDKCVAAMELTRCMYFCSPENYYLP